MSLAEIPCDYYTGSGLKWLLAPTGNGFLHFSAGSKDRLEPMQVSWGYQAPPDWPPEERDPRLECEGTRDICPWLALPESIDFQAELGHDRIRQRMCDLTGHVRRRLTGWRGLVPVTPEHAACQRSRNSPV